MATVAQQVHRFTFTLSIEPDDDAFGRLKAAGCDDATFGVQVGVPYAAFDRQAPSLAEAVLSAIRDLDAAAVEGLAIDGVQADEPAELHDAEAAAIAYIDALLRARRLAPRVPHARELAGRLLVGAK